jgi:hypothetical protein
MRLPLTGLLLGTGLLCALVMPARAQSPNGDERDVIAAVQVMFDAIAACDAVKARAVSVPEGRLYRLVPAPGAQPASSTLEQFAARLEQCPNTMLERMWTPQVRVHKGIASLWAPYDFWIDGKFSHCGIDSFDLVKTPAGWKITGGIYTVEREGCAPSPLGPIR